MRHLLSILGAGATAILVFVPVAHADQVIPDDLIVQGSGCFGFDCVNNESFGFDTIRLKENNLRIGFTDTSVGAFPSNDWEIQVNDSASGGLSHFSIVDVTAGQTLFRICAVASVGCTNIGGAGTDPQTIVNTANIATNTVSIANHETRITANEATLVNHEGRIGSLEQQVSSIGGQIRTNKDGVAMALALGGGASLQPGQNGTLAINYGNFDGASAMGVMGGVRLSDLAVLNGGVGVGFGTGAVGGRVGVQISW